MRPWLLLLACAVAPACDVVYGLDRPPVDARSSDADPIVDAVPDAVDGDDDEDGIRNQADNCPGGFNPDQADEDLDDLGDICDPCPHVAIGLAADADGDRVGDACDPEPTIARQTPILFDGFHGTVLSGEWLFDGVSAWTAENGWGSTTATGGVTYLATSLQEPHDLRIEAAFEVSATSGTGGILFDYETNANLCGMQDTTSNTRGLYLLAGAVAQLLSGGVGGESATVYTYTVDTAGTNRRCRVDGVDVSTTAAASPHRGRFGIAVTNGTIKVAYVFAIKAQ